MRGLFFALVPRICTPDFAGFGKVAETFGDFANNLLPAAAIGARFILPGKRRVGLAADVGVGNDSTKFYFGVGKAF